MNEIERVVLLTAITLAYKYGIKDVDGAVALAISVLEKEDTSVNRVEIDTLKSAYKKFKEIVVND